MLDQRFRWFVLVLLASLLAACQGVEEATIEPSRPVSTVTPIPNSTATFTPSPTATRTRRPTSMPASTATITQTPILSQTRIPPDICPMGDAEFCDFVLTLQPLILNSDIEGILRYAHYDICKSFEGWIDCRGETYCLEIGMLQGDGGCEPISDARHFWERYAALPLVITGVVYPIIPGIGLETIEELSGPVILVKTYDEKEHDLLIFCQEYDDRRFISALLLQNETAAQYQTPEQIIIRWP